ncbi:MAG: helix-hairpin-helix domain-containing protein [Eubacteriales bacterium]|nr:helix-hairpin-helix domain-containing protein [Eubacteriales bacterium]
MDHKIKRNVKYIILAAGFIISAAFYVKSGIPDEIKLSNEVNTDEFIDDDKAEEYKADSNCEIKESNADRDVNSVDKIEELDDNSKKIIKEYVREVLGEYLEAERLREEYDREHTEILKMISSYTNGNNPADSTKEFSKDEIVKNNEEADSKAEDKININTADKEELMELGGIGEKKAEDIINYRKEHGVFLSIEELKEIKGIKASLYEKIKDFITV